MRVEQVPRESGGSPSWRYSLEAGLGDFQMSPLTSYLVIAVLTVLIIPGNIS